MAGSSICSAAFYESAALRASSPWPVAGWVESSGREGHPSLPLAQRSVFARLRQADTFTRSAAANAAIQPQKNNGTSADIPLR